MLALTIAAGVLAVALAVSIILRASDRFPTEVRGPGPWGLRSEVERPAELTSAELRWRDLLAGSTSSHKPWERLTTDVEKIAEVFELDPVDPPRTFSRNYLEERLAALEGTQGANQ